LQVDIALNVNMDTIHFYFY